MRRRVVAGLLVGVGLLLGSCSFECTLVGCSSTLTMSLSHSLDLPAGPYRLEVTTPAHELTCSIGPEEMDTRSCFGFRFADLSYDPSTVTLVLTEPFDGDGEPFDAVEIALFRGSEELSRQTVAVERGEPLQPNGPGCDPTCWMATVAAAI